MQDKHYQFRPAGLSDLTSILTLGHPSFCEEWTIEEVAEILWYSQETSLMVLSEQKPIGFMLGLSYYIPQIPAIPSRAGDPWNRIENVGRIAYACIASEWRGKRAFDELMYYYEEISRLAGRKAIVGTIQKKPKRYKSTITLFKRKGYVSFDNFGYPKHPDYEYLMKVLEEK